MVDTNIDETLKQRCILLPEASWDAGQVSKPSTTVIQSFFQVIISLLSIQCYASLLNLVRNSSTCSVMIW